MVSVAIDLARRKMSPENVIRKMKGSTVVGVGCTGGGWRVMVEAVEVVGWEVGLFSFGNEKELI